MRIRALETTKENEKVCEECGYPYYEEYDIENMSVFYRCENKTCAHFNIVRSRQISYGEMTQWGILSIYNCRKVKWDRVTESD